ncbi:hypothetical protein SAY86_008997 [Trapa natans]|uniref:Uncharacterized protein n=1 Tax=Trapa natans TaxID=22666 RepID=A0AAN7KDU2_TRANT|nr:hypothetical protein SAY86_008997 [Trapa natans]
MYYSIHFFLLILLLLITRFFYIHLFSNGRRHVKLPPGPKGWPVIGALHLLGDKPNQSLAAIAKKYGPLMHLRLGTIDMVVASNPAMARTFLKTLDGDFLDRPYTTAARITYDAHDMVFGEYGPKWKLMRKLTSLHILGAKALEHGATVRQEEVGVLVRAIRDAATVNVPEILSCTLANIISRLVFSWRMIQAGDEGPASRFKDLVNEAVALSSQFNIGDFIPSIAWMNPQGVEGEMKKTHRKFDQMMDEMIQLHVNAAGDREGKPDFLDILMADGGDSGYPSPLSSNNIKGLLLDLFIAGTDTSSSTIEWALAELMSDPALLGRAREELDRVIGPDRRLCESDLANLPYLRAICKEVFRKHPATPLIPRVAAKDCHVDGYDIPRGTRR